MNLTEEALQYHQQLLDDERLVGWHHQRGLSDRTIAEFCLGAVVEPLSEPASWYQGSPTIPYVTIGGKVIELKVRRVGVDKDKYRNIGRDFPLPAKTHLFNAQQAMPSPRTPQVFLVEGEYDAMIAVQCGLRAVAVPGVSNFNVAWCHLFADSEPVIVMDGDDAGRAAAGRLAGLFDQRRIRARLLTMPNGMDVTDLYLEGGADRVREVLR